MVRKACLILALLVLIAALVPAQERLAVLDTVLPEGIDKKVVIPITEKIMEEFVQSKLFIVVDRSFIEKSLSEMEFNLSDLVTNDEKLSEFGGFLKATYIVVSTVQRLETRYFISAKMIEVKTGVIIAQASADKDGSSAVLIDMAGVVGEKLVLSAMGKSAPQGGSDVAKTEPQKEKSPAKPIDLSGNERFSTLGILAGLGLISMEVEDGSFYYDFFSLDDLDYYDHELVSGYGIGIDVRYPLYRYFYVGAAGSYAEYSYYDTFDWETFVSFTEVTVLAGSSFAFGAFQPYIGVGLAYLAGSGEYLDEFGVLQDEYGWSGLPFGFEIGLDYRLSKLFFAGARYSRFSGFITSDSGFYDSTYTSSGLMLRFGIVF